MSHNKSIRRPVAQRPIPNPLEDQWLNVLSQIHKKTSGSMSHTKSIRRPVAHCRMTSPLEDQCPKPNP